MIEVGVVREHFARVQREQAEAGARLRLDALGRELGYEIRPGHGSADVLVAEKGATGERRLFATSAVALANQLENERPKGGLSK